MGSPVSPIVANLCMEEIEELAHNQSTLPPKKWFRFVDDIFSIIKRHMLTNFYNFLNSINSHIKFTMKPELERKLSFLDTLNTRNNGYLFINVYRKPTHTDRYLDYNSHHGKQHKVCTAQTLLHRAETIPNTTEGKQQEGKHITDTFISNGYPRKFLQEVEKKQALKESKALSPEDLVKDFFDLAEPPTNYSYAILSYTKGLTEPLKRLLKPHGITVSKKPLQTLEQSFPSIKVKSSPENQTNVVYKIDCADCSRSYIGETGRTFNTRRTEHKRNVQHNKVGSNIANHG